MKKNSFRFDIIRYCFMFLIMILSSTAYSQDKAPQLHAEYYFITKPMKILSDALSCGSMNLYASSNASYMAFSNHSADSIIMRHLLDELEDPRTPIIGKQDNTIPDFSIYKDFCNNTLYYNEPVFETVYSMVEKPMPHFSWELIQEKRNILGFPCQKAKTHFRGRTWTVWFTEEIPIQNGPWKFHGLPGLILIAHDEDKIFQFIAANIEYPTQLSFQIKPKTTGKVLELKEFIKIHEREISKILFTLKEEGKYPADVENFRRRLTPNRIELSLD